VVCSSGIGFDPVLQGTRLTFGFHGIYQGTAVLYDRQTKSLWLHLTGECIEGKHAGKSLRPLESGRHTKWREWRRAHFDGDVMAPDPVHSVGYFSRTGSQAGEAYLSTTFLRTIQDRDPRLGMSDLVYGVRAGVAVRAYPFDALRRTGGVVEERVGLAEVTVWYDRDSNSAAAFDRRWNGTPLSFERVGEGRFRDRDTESVWNQDGVCVQGARDGARLERIDGLQSEWYGWYALHPDTTVWQP
jgi:hypothetical protein